MNPVDLFNMCMESIQSWNEGPKVGDGPSVLLVVARKTCPTGRTVALLGRHGPRGRIATIKETPQGYDIAAYFSAVAIIEALGQAFGIKGPIVQRMTSEKHANSDRH